ncbi:hypothetical protein T4E_11583 [Trichinella pseudospiralis]|uniref:Uncharacterized protein n=1 Tax=Trichinella pseudospiralis TaxID=6337 RepID=A0A0V0XHG0_TRIPS|nr:hypothetical protein T4E_11583 [Trichinella pseudospiralis]
MCINEQLGKENQFTYEINVPYKNAFNNRSRCFFELESIQVIDESFLDMEFMDWNPALSNQWYIPMS